VIVRIIEAKKVDVNEENLSSNRKYTVIVSRFLTQIKIEQLKYERCSKRLI
jgi:hypothetical protein